MIPTMTNYDYLVEAISTPTDDCLVWPYAKTRGGYGKVKANGRTRPAHRVALELTKPRPMGKVCSAKGNWVPGHKLDTAHGPCHNRLCINPQHLSWKTSAENKADKKRDGTHQANENHGRCKLSNVDVARIRELYKGKGKGPSQSELAGQFGCSRQHIFHIVHNKNRV